MEAETENKLDFKDKIINFFNKYKVKLYIIIFLLILIISFLKFINFNNKKNNIIISEKYIQAGIYLLSNKKEEAKNIFEEIIITKNNIYAILALNSIIEKNLINDKEKILEYFSLLENYKFSKDQKDIISLKKALYLIKSSDQKLGKKILKDLAERKSNISSIAQELITE